MIFSGYSYDETGPYFIFYDDEMQKYKKQYLNKKSFTIEKLSERYCVGAYNLSTLSYSPCPKKHKLDLNSKINLCTECNNKVGFNPAFYNAKKISPQQLKYNETPHIVYLAYFSPSHIKSGIASKRRFPLRLLEQGARAAFILKTFPNAYLARELEARLCGNGYGILERLTSSQKLKIIIENKYSSKIAKKSLNEILKQIAIEPESDFLQFDLKYFYENKYDLSNLEKVEKPEFISGEAIGMLGDIAILKQQNLLVALPIKKFISYKIKINYDKNFLEYPIEPQQIALW